VHGNYYPTVWHYEQSEGDLSGRLPSFIIGRNPYVRLVSGYLDKLAGRDIWNQRARAARPLRAWNC
jgi:Sulfotransferase family